MYLSVLTQSFCGHIDMMIIILLLVYVVNPNMGFIIGDSMEVKKITIQSKHLFKTCPIQ